MTTTTCPLCLGEALVIRMNAECTVCGHWFRSPEGQEFDRNVKVLFDFITAPVRWVLERLSRRRG